MANDVKIEILYYKTNSDISLEFGIRGNYPIRLLSAVCDSSESFLRNLKRALQRSEIIITAGGYDGGTYLPSLIAKAIGTSCTSPNYKSHNIISKKIYKRFFCKKIHFLLKKFGNLKKSLYICTKIDYFYKKITFFFTIFWFFLK